MANIKERISKTGKKFYQVQIRRTGYKSISKAFDKLSDARDFAAITEAKLLKNELVNRDAIKHTIKLVIDQFLEADHKEPITQKSQTRLRYLQHVNELGSFTVQTLTPKMLSKWINKRLVFNKPPTVYWYYCNLKKAMMWHALQNDYRQDLFQIAKCPTTVTARNRRIDDAEIKLLHKAMAMHMRVNVDEMKWAIDFALNTAMRAGEMIAFKWSDVNLKERYVYLRKEITKTKAGRHVPLTSDALQVLMEMKAKYYKGSEDSGKRVFGCFTDTRHLCRQFKIICEWAGIKDLSWHFTRHEAASRFYEGTNLTDVEIASITGHKDVRVLANHYAHLRPQSLLVKLSKLDSRRIQDA